MKLSFTDTNINYKSFLLKDSIPLSDISKAYMRVEEVGATMCCGRANFNRYFLMLCCSSNPDSPHKLEMNSEQEVKDSLSKIKELLPNVEIGK